MVGSQYIRWFYYTGLVGIIAGMSLSKPGVSTGIFVCLGAWLLEKDLLSRVKSLKNHPFFWISLGLIMVHAIGLLWTENLSYGFKDIKTKLPLLVIPMIFFSSNVFRLKEEMKFIKLIFISSLVVCTLFSFGIYFHWIKPTQFNPSDIRTMIFGVSGVRLALFICLALAFLTSDFYHQRAWLFRAVYLMLAAWFLFFLNFIESGTAVIFILILLFYSFLYLIFTKFNRFKRRVAFLVGLVVIVVSAVTVYNFLDSVYKKRPDPTRLAHTKNGEPYRTDLTLPYLENGYVVGENIAINELTLAWNKRSKIKIGERDKSGQLILRTLLRYLNSRNGIKDANAVNILTNAEVINIENGIANYHYQFMFGWQKRLLQIIFEIESYRIGHNPFGNSLTQRFEYWKIATNLFMSNVFIGIGTGDVKYAYEDAYNKYSFAIDPRYKLRAHNQYLSIAVALGMFGLLVFLIYVFSIIWTKSYRENRYLALAFLIIMFFSFLSEDTLETQSGVTFIVFFHTLFNLRRD